MVKPKVIVPLADGAEEMEAVIIIDVLRRGDLEVTAASIKSDKVINCSRGVTLVADVLWDDIEPANYDAVILPGGAVGADNLARFSPLAETIREFQASGKLVGAICAAPLVLQNAGVLRGVPATCYPTLGSELNQSEFVPERVVKSGNIITSQGPGTAMEFALAVLEYLADSATAESVKSGLIMHPSIH